MSNALDTEKTIEKRLLAVKNLVRAIPKTSDPIEFMRWTLDLYRQGSSLYAAAKTNLVNRALEDASRPKVCKRKTK